MKRECPCCGSLDVELADNSQKYCLYECQECQVQFNIKRIVYEGSPDIFQDDLEDAFYRICMSTGIAYKFEEEESYHEYFN